MKSASFLLPSALMGISLLIGCGEKKQFGAGVNNQTQTGDVSGNGSANKIGGSTSGGPSAGSPIPEECKTATANFTKVTLLSKSMSTKPSVQSLKYELSSVSCKDGKIVPIKDESLFFDLNGKISGPGFTPINYAVNDSKTGALITQGTLEVVQGSDLFGNTGQYAHWKTSTLSYAGSLEKVILEIKLDNIGLTPAQMDNAPTMDSYLRVGQTIPVTQPIMVTY